MLYKILEGFSGAIELRIYIDPKELFSSQILYHQKQTILNNMDLIRALENHKKNFTLTDI